MTINEQNEPLTMISLFREEACQNILSLTFSRDYFWGWFHDGGRDGGVHVSDSMGMVSDIWRKYERDSL